MSVWFKRVFLGIAVLGLLAAAPAQAQNGLSRAAAVFEACPDPATEPVDVPTPCLGIVSFDSAVSRDERAVIVRGAGAAVRFNFTIVGAVAVLVPNEAAYWALADDPDVTAFTPDRRVEAFGKPERCSPWPSCKDGGEDPPAEDPPVDDPGGSYQPSPSGVARIRADMVWDNLFLTGSGVGVAILDTGLDKFHTDLADNVAEECYDAIDPIFGDCSDGNGHGTHVGGTVAALDNEIDVVGVAPEATLYAVRVLDDLGNGTDSTVMEGLEWVVRTLDPADPDYVVGPPIQVVNMSLGRAGSVGDNPALWTAIHNVVVDAGITVVVAAGNDPFSEISEMVPASYPEVMAVASTTAQGGNNKCKRYKGRVEADTASYFTTDGANDPDDPNDENDQDVAISAPGEQKENISRTCYLESVGILSLQAGGGTTQKSGTSMASPHVAGVVALMLEANSNLAPDTVRCIVGDNAELVGTAPIGSPTGGYSYDGTREGIVDAVGAVDAAIVAACSP